MSKQRFEYKVAFVDFRGRVSIEGDQTLIEEGERMTAFGRRYLNALGEQGWELVGTQMQHDGNAFHIFKRALAEGEQAEPRKPVEAAALHPPNPTPFTQPFPGPTFWEHPVPPPHRGGPHPADHDVIFHIVRRGPDDPTPREFVPPQP